MSCGDFNNYFNGEEGPSTAEREGLRGPYGTSRSPKALSATPTAFRRPLFILRWRSISERMSSYGQSLLAGRNALSRIIVTAYYR